MSDVASILGIKPTSASSTEETLKLITGSNKQKASKPKIAKPAGMARELFSLVGHDSLAPSVQPHKVIPSYKTKRSNVAKPKWIWAPFQNSART